MSVKLSLEQASSPGIMGCYQGYEFNAMTLLNET